MTDRATADDWPAVEARLLASALPLGGAQAAFSTGLVAHADGELIGCAAIERYGATALLRSVAVREDHRGRGLGRELVAAAEELARDDDASELILLTETAESFFARFGFDVIDRMTVADDVAASIEFSTACPSTAVAMRRRLV